MEIRSGSTADADSENRSAEDFLSVSYGKSRKSGQAAAGANFQTVAQLRRLILSYIS